MKGIVVTTSTLSRAVGKVAPFFLVSPVRSLRVSLRAGEFDLDVPVRDELVQLLE